MKTTRFILCLMFLLAFLTTQAEAGMGIRIRLLTQTIQVWPDNNVTAWDGPYPAEPESGFTHYFLATGDPAIRIDVSYYPGLDWAVYEWRQFEPMAPRDWEASKLTYEDGSGISGGLQQGREYRLLWADTKVYGQSGDDPLPPPVDMRTWDSYHTSGWLRILVRF